MSKRTSRPASGARLEEGGGGAGDAPLLTRAQGFHRRGESVPGLDLDHGKGASAPGDDVDLAHGHAKAAGKDAIPAEPEVPGAQGLGHVPEPPGAPFLLLPAPPGLRGATGHRRFRVSARARA